MKEPFDIELFDKTYAVFPEEDDCFTIYKEGIEYLHIQRDGESGWLKLNPETGLPMFGLDEEVNLIGKAISDYFGQN